jgi:hypothetical protein
VNAGCRHDTLGTGKTPSASVGVAATSAQPMSRPSTSTNGSSAHPPGTTSTEPSALTSASASSPSAPTTVQYVCSPSAQRG